MKSRSVLVLGAVASIALLALVFSLAAQTKKEAAAPSHSIIHYSDLKWTPIMKDTDFAVVSGDPNAAGGLYVLRIRCTDGTKIPPHWHPEDENVTVMKGALLVGMGETYDETKLQTMNFGNFTTVPKEMRHFASCKGDTIVQVHGVGPFKVNWVNPQDVIPPDAKK
jgi:hypothetical protein